MSRPRQRWFYHSRVSFVIIGAVVLLLGLLVNRDAQNTTVGLQIFTWLAVATLISMCPFCMTASGMIIMREKEERTLGLLFLSDISEAAFVAGKALASVWSASFMLLSAMPLLLLAISLGGVGALQILMALLLVLSVMFLSVGLGLLAGARARTERAINSLPVFSGLLLFAVPPILLALLWTALDIAGDPPRWVLMLISPVAAVWGITGGTDLGGAMGNCCINFCLGAICMLLVPATVRRGMCLEAMPVREKLRDQLRRGVLRRFVHSPRMSSGNPLAWKDFYYVYGGHRANWLGMLTLVFLLAATIGMVVYGNRHMTISDGVESLMSTLPFVCMFVTGLVSLGRFGLAFTREMKHRSVEMLLVTDLTDSELVLGKLWAVMKSLIPWFVCLAVSSMVLVAAEMDLRKRSDIESLIAISGEALAMWFGYSSLALLLSLLFRKAVAPGICILLFILYNTLWRFILISILVDTRQYYSHLPEIMVGLDIAVHLGLGTVCLLVTFMSVRRLLLRHAAE